MCNKKKYSDIRILKWWKLKLLFAYKWLQIIIVSTVYVVDHTFEYGGQEQFSASFGEENMFRSPF